MDRQSAALVGMTTVAGLRLAAIMWRWRLPVFLVSDEDQGKSP